MTVVEIVGDAKPCVSCFASRLRGEEFFAPSRRGRNTATGMLKISPSLGKKQQDDEND
jgi:hypothetical protein